MLLSQSLLDHGSFALDDYALPRHQPQWRGYYSSNGPIYQLEIVGEHIYYHMPSGSSVLSAPFVAALNVFGISAAKPDGTYDPQGEALIEARLAAVLMAVLASIFFLTGRLMLSSRWATLVALAGALGTQVYSTASRALWSDTWGILLCGVVVFIILAHETGKRRLNPVLLATLLAWMYFVRPTFSVPILAVSIYVFIFHRRVFLSYAATGLAWLAGFFYYSWSHYGHLLPTYYRANRLQFNVFWIALAGNLISPARGLLVYVPMICFLAYLLVRYRHHLSYMRLVWLSLFIIVVHILVISGFPHWWGGHSFGPRFTTSLVPWFVLLSILAIGAMLAWREKTPKAKSPGWSVQLAVGWTLLILSAFINTRGAASHATWRWNMRPRGVDEHPERLWDWREPQFLAGYVPLPLPREFPIATSKRIDFASSESEKYLWYGWSEASPGPPWSYNDAGVVFEVHEIKPMTIRINIEPFLVSGKLEAQRLKITLNGTPLTALTLNSRESQVYSLTVSKGLLRQRNIMIFEAPDAQSPQRLGVGEDPNLRGINLHWIEFEELQ